MKRTDKQRIAALEQQVKLLHEHVVDREGRAHLITMGNRITHRLLELGPDKVDLRLVAKLNAALGTDVLPLNKKAPKEVRDRISPKKKKP